MEEESPHINWPRRHRLEGIPFGALHPQIVAVSGDLYLDGHYPQAITEAFKAIDVRVRQQSGLLGSGQALMANALAYPSGPIQISEELGQSGEDEQEGFRFIYMGALRGIRNPKSHELSAPLSQRRTMEYLAVASLLMRRLDDAINAPRARSRRQAAHDKAAAQGILLGAIEGIIGYPSEGVPALRLYALRVDKEQAYLVETEGSHEMVRFRIEDVLPGIYHVVAFRPGYPHLSGGYTRFVLAGLSADAPDDHTLIDVEVGPGMTAKDVQVTDWYAMKPLMPEPSAPV